MDQKSNINIDDLAAFSDELSDIYYRTDAEGRIVYVSKAVERLLGYPAEHHIGTKLSDLYVDPQGRDVFLEEMRKSGGVLSNYEVALRHKDGSEVWVSSSSKFLFDDKGDVSGLEGITRNVTERRKTDQFNLATSNILRMIATGEDANDIFEEIALLYESRHPGMRCSMLILKGNKLLHGGAPSLPEEYCVALNGLENGPNVGSCGTSTFTGKSVFVEDIETDPKWEDIKHLALPHGLRCCWSEPIKNASGEVLGAFGMYYNHPGLPNEKEKNDLKSAANLAAIVMTRDNSEQELLQHRQHLEELVSQRTLELEEVMRLATDASRSKSVFLANMSHELRTPLNAIVGFSETLSEKIFGPLQNEKQEEYVHNIHDAGLHLLELINDVLDLSAIEAKKLEIYLEEVDIAETVAASLLLVRSRADQRSVQILDATQDKQFVVSSDARRLKQILVNLLSNAIKFNKEGGSITIDAENGSDDSVSLIIADTGIGMTAEEIDQALEPFVQLNEDHLMARDGMGLGLPLTKQLVDALGGKICVQSQPSVGTTIRITLPAENKE